MIKPKVGVKVLCLETGRESSIRLINNKGFVFLDSDNRPYVVKQGITHFTLKPSKKHWGANYEHRSIEGNSYE